MIEIPADSFSKGNSMLVRFQTRPEEIELDLNSAAVVVVDMQNAFACRGGVFDLAGMDVSPAGLLVDTIKGILKTSRENGMQVVYLKMEFKADLSNAGGPLSPNWKKELALKLIEDRPDLEQKPLTEGTWDAGIVDPLNPHSGDLVVVKSRYSGFAGTNLDSLLRTRHIQFLFFVGMAANVCVESTLRDAFCLDYWPILITDATLQAGPDLLLQATIQNVEKHFGWTLTSREFLEALDLKPEGFRL
ncbi:MAG: isochorismatase family protein [Acidobacteriota bacterium]